MTHHNSKAEELDALARELEEQSEDPRLWRQKPAEIVAKPSRSSVLSLRLPTKEFHILLQVAKEAGESISEYVRNAIALRLRNSLSQQGPTTTINVTYTYIGMPTVVESQEWRTWSSGLPETTLIPQQ